jgi:hypothetical protein
MKSSDGSGEFISLGTVVAGLSALLMIVFGWLFNLLVDSIHNVSDRQLKDSKAIVAHDTTIGVNARRLSKLEDEQLHTNRIRAVRPKDQTTD